MLVRVATAASLAVVLFTAGLLAEFDPGDGRVAKQFGDLMAAIPGAGSVYTSFEETSELLLDSDTDSF